MEFKNDRLPKKAEFEMLVASVEFLFPRYKGELGWSRQVLAGWSIHHIPQHTVPLSSGPAHLIAIHMASLGAPRLGAGLLTQQHLGLRPNEMLSLERRDVSLPSGNEITMASAVTVIGLGVRTGTKAKRAQSVVLRDPMVTALVAWACSGLSPEDRLFPFTYENYRRLLKKISSDILHLDIHWTPHSARAGFASDAVAAGRGFTEIREAGRWVADSSLRTYIDVVSAASIATNMRLSGLKPAILFARSHLPEFLPGLEPFIRLHGSGNGEGAGRLLDSDLGRLVGRSPGGLPDPQESEVAGADTTAQSAGGPKRNEARAKGAGARSSKPGASRGRGGDRR